MTADTAPAVHRITLAAFWGAMALIWAIATGLVFPLALLLRSVALPGLNDWPWVPIALFGFVAFYWLASARWPSSSHVARFGFALGSAAINTVFAISAAFVVGTLIHGG
jgi:hypothetical protein